MPMARFWGRDRFSPFEMSPLECPNSVGHISGPSQFFFFEFPDTTVVFSTLL